MATPGFSAMFSNSGSGPFTTVATPSDTPEWRKNCGPLECTSLYSPSMAALLKEAYPGIFPEPKPRGWRKIWAPSSSYRATSKCSNSTPLLQTNSSVNAAAWGSHAEYFDAAKSGTARAGGQGRSQIEPWHRQTGKDVRGRRGGKIPPAHVVERG